MPKQFFFWTFCFGCFLTFSGIMVEIVDHFVSEQQMVSEARVTWQKVALTRRCVHCLLQEWGKDSTVCPPKMSWCSGTTGWIPYHRWGMWEKRSLEKERDKFSISVWTSRCQRLKWGILHLLVKFRRNPTNLCLVLSITAWNDSGSRSVYLNSFWCIHWHFFSFIF